MSSRRQVTPLLAQLSDGNQEALEELLPLLYDELRLIAHRQLRRERPGHTLNTTALVHEAYLKLQKIDRIRWQNRSHFFAVSATVMRRILVNYAKQKKAGKRGGGQPHVPLDNVIALAHAQSDKLLALDEALKRLEESDERQCRIVEYRFFGGMTVEETAEALGISPRTVKREWAAARLWLNRELRE